MNNEKLCEYLSDIGVLLLDNIDIFFKIHSSKNDKLFKNEPEKLKESLFLYLQKTCKSDNSLRLMSKQIIESYYNSQVIIKYKSLKNVVNILTNKLLLRYHNFMLNISKYISNRNEGNNDKKKRTDSDENFWNRSNNSYKIHKNKKPKSQAKKRIQSLKRTNRYKNNFYKNIQENNTNPHSFFINDNNYLNLGKNNFQNSNTYSRNITNVSYDNINNNIEDNLISYKYYSPMVNIQSKKPINNYISLNKYDDLAQPNEYYYNDFNINSYNNMNPIYNKISSEEYTDENFNLGVLDDYDFLENEKKHLQKVQNKLMNLKNEKITKIEEQCSFAPQINSNYKFKKNQNRLNVFDKLYNDFSTNKSKKEDKIKKHLEQFKFTPKIEGNDKYKITSTFEERRKKKSLEKNKKIQNDGVKKSKKRKIDKEEMIKRLYKKEIEKLKEKNEKEDKLKKLEEKKKHVIDWKKVYKDYYKKYPEGEDYKKQIEKRKQLFENLSKKRAEEQKKAEEKNNNINSDELKEKENNNNLNDNKDDEQKIFDGEEINTNNNNIHLDNNIEEDKKENSSNEPEAFKSSAMNNLLKNNNLFKDAQ